jgi:PadR family transcriptional regulator, regulatory protein PadR
MANAGILSLDNLEKWPHHSSRLSRGATVTNTVTNKNKSDLLQGTLDMLVLKALQLEPMHGWGITERIEQWSQKVLQVNQGSLYPALYRLQRQGWITSSWKITENNRRARYYALTAAGRRQLAVEQESWDRLSEAVNLVMRMSTS